MCQLWGRKLPNFCLYRCSQGFRRAPTELQLRQSSGRLIPLLEESEGCLNERKGIHLVKYQRVAGFQSKDIKKVRTQKRISRFNCLSCLKSNEKKDFFSGLSQCNESPNRPNYYGHTWLLYGNAFGTSAVS